MSKLVLIFAAALVALPALLAPDSTAVAEAAQTARAAQPETAARQPAKFAGGYRIAGWRGLEAKGFFHFFYLHPNGGFLLGAEWPGRETGRAAGSWSGDGERITLVGKARVETNQGSWRVDFSRTYRVTVDENGIGLRPVPRKNRYGLLGWPNAYYFHRRRPSPNLPMGDIPADERNIAVMIAALREAWR